MPKNKTIVALIILCLFHLIFNLIWNSNFENSVSLIYDNKDISSFNSRGHFTYLPQIFEPAKSVNLPHYKISAWLFPFVKYLPGHFFFLNTLLFVSLIIITFLTAKELKDTQTGIIAAFIISFYPYIYITSRQISFRLLNIVMVSLTVLFLIYSSNFSKLFYTVAAAILCLSLKYFVPQTETTLSYFVLAGPIIYFFSKTARKSIKNIRNKKYFLCGKSIFYIFIFLVIIFCNFQYVYSWVFSNYVSIEFKRFSKLNAWYQILKKENQAQLLIKLKDNFFIHLETKNSSDITPLVKNAKLINLHTLMEFDVLEIKNKRLSSAQKTDTWKNLISYLPPVIAGQKMKYPPEGKDLSDSSGLIYGAAASAFYGHTANIIKAGIYINSPQTKNLEKIYAQLIKQGEIDNDTVLNKQIEIKGFDIMDKPILLLSYWFILAIDLLRPLFMGIFALFFLLYFRIHFKGKWLLISWIFIPLTVLSFINKKLDWYILATIPGFALLTAHFISYFIRKKSVLKIVILFSFLGIIMADFFCLSFFPDTFPSLAYLDKHFQDTAAIKFMRGFHYRPREKSTRREELFSEIKKYSKNKIVTVNIFNDYEFFKELSFYALLEKDINAVFNLIKNKNKENYEIIYN